MLAKPFVALLAAAWRFGRCGAGSPEAFVDAASIVPGLIVEMRYFGSHNFVGRPIDGYERPLCLLTREAAEALAEVARDLATMGLVLKVFDCYRPTRAVAHFMRWARDLGDTAGKAEFYPGRRQARSVSRRLYRRAVRALARLDASI